MQRPFIRPSPPCINSAVVPEMATKLGDAKPQVRAAAMQGLQRLMKAVAAQSVLDLLVPLAGGSIAGSAGAREQAVNAFIVVG